MRLSAAKVLSHPWLETNSTTELPSSAMFRLNNNAKHLNEFAESASAVNRVMLQHCSGIKGNFLGNLSVRYFYLSRIILPIKGLGFVLTEIGFRG